MTPSAESLEGRALLATFGVNDGEPSTALLQVSPGVLTGGPIPAVKAANTDTQQPGTVTRVVSSMPSAPLGSPVTFTATVAGVTPGSTPPPGVVNFIIDGGAPRAVTLDEIGVARLTLSDLSVGNHTVVVEYLGSTQADDVRSPSSASLAGGQNVTLVVSTTTTSLTASPDPATAGQPVTFTATIIAAEGTPGGTVVFLIDGVPQNAFAMPMVEGAAQATLTTSALTVGQHTITATFVGDASFTTSTSDPLILTVNAAPVSPPPPLETPTPATTTTSLTASADSTTVGQPVTFTATITAETGIPGGTVVFSIDGAAQDPVAVQMVSGVARATLTTSALTAGQHTITATFVGDASFTTSTSSPLILTVNAAQVPIPPQPEPQPPTPTPPITPTPATPSDAVGPQVVGVTTTRRGVRNTLISIRFSESLDASRASNTGNYRLVGRRQRAFRILSAAYDPVTGTVTLRARRSPFGRQGYTIQVNGRAPGGITDVAGNLLNSVFAGAAGNDYVARFRA